MPKWWLTLVLSTLSVGTLAGSMAPQASRSDVEQTPAMVAQLLVERGAVVELPVRGKVSRKIEMEDDTFAMHDGPSRVVLLRLPEYQAPYVLTVKSFLYKRAMSRTEKIFVPTTILLDGSYKITRTVSEAELESNRAGMVKGPSYQATIPITEAQRDERFVLIHTNGGAIGGPIRVVNQRLFFRAQRSADGDIEAETKPTK
jgi:hypothetical protein